LRRFHELYKVSVTFTSSGRGSVFWDLSEDVDAKEMVRALVYSAPPTF